MTRVVHVFDAKTGERLEGADVYALSPSGAIRFSCRTSEGVGTMLQWDELVSQVEASADGYAVERVDTTGVGEGPIHLRLTRSARIQGEFLDHWGAHAGSGALVLAYQASSGEPNWSRIATEGPDFCEDLAFAYTNGAGEFSMSGLRLGSQYVVRAMAPGVVSNVARVSALEEVNRVQLVGGFLQVARVEVIDAETELTPVVNPLIRGHGVGVSPVFQDGRSVRVSAVSDRALVASGVPLENLVDREIAFSTTLTIMTGFEDRDPCSAKLRVSVPGFRVQSSDVVFTSALQRVSTSTVYLDSIGTGIGKIGLVVGLSNESEGRQTAKPSAVLRLKPASRESGLPAWLDFPLEHLEPFLVIDGVPVASMKRNFDLETD